MDKQFWGELVFALWERRYGGTSPGKNGVVKRVTRMLQSIDSDFFHVLISKKPLTRGALTVYIFKAKFKQKGG
jgi:hypothetical protein